MPAGCDKLPNIFVSRHKEKRANVSVVTRTQRHRMVTLDKTQKATLVPSQLTPPSNGNVLPSITNRISPSYS